MTDNPHNAALGNHNIILGDDEHAAMVRHMCRHTLRHLTGLKTLSIEWVGSSVHALKMLCRTATVAGLALSIRMLMKLPRLYQINMTEQIDDFKLVFEKVLADEHKAGRTVIFENLSPQPPEDAPTRKHRQYILSWNQNRNL